jgi:hypothetical protein
MKVMPIAFNGDRHDQISAVPKHRSEIDSVFRDPHLRKDNYVFEAVNLLKQLRRFSANLFIGQPKLGYELHPAMVRDPRRKVDLDR